MMVAQMLRPWLATASPAAVHLVMCPFAGGSSGAFRDWHSIEDQGIEVSLAVYPGRDHRMQEACAQTIELLADALVDELRGLGTSLHGLILAGHSMGAQVAFEACLRLERHGMPPSGLVLSGCHAPHMQGRRQLSHLDDHAFLGQLVQIGGCKPALLADPSLMAALLPMLRADFRATEAYRRQLIADHARLCTPTLLVYGSRDTEASRDEVAAWRKWLDDTDDPIAIAGDHFYATRRPRAFLGQILQHFESDSLRTRYR